MNLTQPGVGTGVAVVRGGRLLLLHRRRPPETGAWGLPGGKVDLYEKAADAAAREIREETGLAIDVSELLCVVDHIDPAEGRHWFAPIYLVIDETAEPALMEPEKHAGLEWFALDALPERLTGPHARRPAGAPRPAQSALGRRRIVNSTSPPGRRRQLSTCVQ